jgi:uncharacterized repeat protein (TIGR03803 family)
MRARSSGVWLAIICCALTACGGGSGGGASGSPQAATYTISGFVDNMTAGTSIVLSDNGADLLTITTNENFTFPTALSSGSKYSVAVATQPAGQGCTVNAGSGTLGSGNVDNIIVQCEPKVTIGGTVTGLAQGASVALLDNGGDLMTVTSNTTFTFLTALAFDSNYQVTVDTQPAGQTCTVNYPSGTAPNNITNVIVQCTAESVLWSFGVGADGVNPAGAPLQASDGNFYGVTIAGGTYGRGMAYRLTPGGTETALWNFGGATDGSSPAGALILGADGNFYGTTNGGGQSGFGTVYRLTPEGTETILWNFGDVPNDGQNPQAGLLLANDGNFYGTTFNGGSAGMGTVFRVTPDGTESVLWNFWVTVGDGNNPTAAPIQGSDGNLYGTCQGGGTADWGTIYRITLDGAETVLWSFIPGEYTTSTDGTSPTGPLVQGPDGNLYGTTYDTAAVFEYHLAQQYENVLWHFGYSPGSLGSQDGSAAEAGLIVGQDGNLYGVTDYGGTTLGGTAFRITPDGLQTVLWNFGVGKDGSNVKSNMIQAADGAFYGVTFTGGANGRGTLYRLTP